MRFPVEVKWDTTEQNPEERERMAHLTRLAARGIQKSQVRFPNQPKMCATCAFRPGTEANRNQWVLHMVIGQLLSDELFFCHHGLPVDEDGFIRSAHASVCAGFVGILEALQPAAGGEG